MHHVIADISVIPMGTDEIGISQHIVRAEGVIRNYPDLKVDIGPMSTSLEGDLDRVLQAVKDMHEATFSDAVQRVSTIIRIDDRHDGKHESLNERVQAVKEKLHV